MATSNCTLGNRFAESKILAKTRFKQKTLHTTEHSPPLCLPLFDTYIAELMETLRNHMNAVLRLPMPVQKRSRLVRNSDLHRAWEVEYLVKEIRLQLEPLANPPTDSPTAASVTPFTADAESKPTGDKAKQNQAENHSYTLYPHMNPP